VSPVQPASGAGNVDANAKGNATDNGGHDPASATDAVCTRGPPTAPSARPPLLRVRGLAFGYDDEPLLDNVDLDLEAGRGSILCGANGSGKSTLLRLLAGLVRPDEGLIERAQDSRDEPLPAAWLGHALGLKTGLTVGESLHFACRLHGADQRMGPSQALTSVALSGYEQVPVRELSAGQRKRVALARLLLVDAPIWLLDEPYANLDPDGCLLVDRLIDRHLRSGGTLALSVHRSDQAGFAGPRQLVMLDRLAESS